MRGRSIALCQCTFIILAVVARACHVLPLTEEGFGGNMLHLLHAISIYDNDGGGTFMVDHTKFPYRCDDTNKGGFTDFWNYTGVIPWSQEAQADVEKKTGTTCKQLDFLSVDHQVSLLGATWDDLDSVALRRIWHLQPDVQREVDAALRDMRNWKAPTIAFHVRGDGLDENLLFSEAPATGKLNDLLGTFQQTFPDVKGGTCLLLGDAHGAIDKAAETIHKALGCKIYKRKKFYREEGYDADDLLQQQSEQRCKLTMHLIADMELMARADYLVGSLDYNVPHIVQTMRFALHKKDRRTFVDASEKHRDWYESIRAYFREDAKLHPRGDQQKATRTHKVRKKGKAGR